MTAKEDLSGLGGRQLKKQIRRLLASEAEIEDVMAAVEQIPARIAVNPLFACFYDQSPRVKWGAVAIMGGVVSQLAETHMESARVIMRRLMWNLNDESGGIGWGSPEAMGEITAQSRPLANEFGCIVGSYVRRDQNFLEHEGLQRGSIWGVGRLAQARPELLADTVGDLQIFLGSSDAYHRGYAAWALGHLKSREAISHIRLLVEDPAEIDLFRRQKLSTTQVGRLAKDALAQIENG